MYHSNIGERIKRSDHIRSTYLIKVHIPKTDNNPKTNIMYHNHTFGGFKRMVVVRT